MTKNDYLDLLRSELKRNNTAEAEDIVSEYEQHFAFKLADGYSEEEIAVKLGSPQVAARQFDGMDAPEAGGFFLKLALFFVAVFETLLYSLFLIGAAVPAVSAAAFATLGLCLIGRFDITGQIPYMPYAGALILGVSMLGLAGILGAGTYYCFAFFRQMVRASVRWHRNLAAGTRLPRLSWSPQFEAGTRRALRGVLLLSVVVFGIMFVAAFIVLMLTAGSAAFWHHWHWFV
ncbi:MAG: DUF1700 domain-containing protein [Oscillospiraceae bacterium]|jgi:hypothetical protein|nr:DUF1700 domain-containing protein [Oscillospiraceae bacterium]